MPNTRVVTSLPVDGSYTLFLPYQNHHKTFFLEGNHQTHSDLGTNNLVPHVLVIIWLQARRIGTLQCPKAPCVGWETNQVWPIDKPTSQSSIS